MKGGAEDKRNSNKKCLIFNANPLVRELTLWHLSGEGRRDELKMQVLRSKVDWHLPSFGQVQPVAEALIQDLVDGVASPIEHDGLSVLCKHHVIVCQGSCAGNNSLFAIAHHVERYQTLPNRGRVSLGLNQTQNLMLRYHIQYISCMSLQVTSNNCFSCHTSVMRHYSS